jgi:hypothetical protein
VAEIRQKLNHDLKAAPAGQGPESDAARQTRRELLTTAHAAIEGLLTDEQKPRAPKLAYKIGMLGFAGIPADALDELNLSMDQVNQISQPVADVLKNAKQAMQGLTPEERVAKTRQIVSDFRATAISVMTPEQRQKLDEYVRAHPPRLAPPAPQPK